MANDTMTPDSVAQMSAAMSSMGVAAESVQDTMAQMQESSASINTYLSTVSGTTDAFAKAASELAGTLDDISNVLDVISTKQATQIKNEKDKLALMEKQKTLQNKLIQGMKSFAKSQPQQVAAQAKAITGMSIGIGSIITLLMKAGNNMRMVSGMSKQAAGHMQLGVQSVKAMRTATMQLRNTFRLTHEEAGKVVGSLAQMGMSAEEIEGKMFKKGTFQRRALPKSLANEARRMAEEDARTAQDMKKRLGDKKYKAVLGEGPALSRTEEGQFDYLVAAGSSAKEIALKSYVDTAKKAHKEIEEDRLKRFNDGEKKRQKAFKTTYGAAQELYAMEKQFGVAVQISASFVKNMEQDYGKANDEGRNMLGAAIEMATQLDNIGVSELIDDWNTLIAQAKTYKTDVNGILALYNVMMRKESGLGLGSIPTSVKKGIVATTTAWTASLDLGLKAKLGKGTSPAERALEFESAGYGNQLQRFMEFAKSNVRIGTGTPAEEARSKVRVRQLAEMYKFDPDVQKHLADLVVTGTTGNKDAKTFSEEYAKQQEKLVTSAQKWEEGKGDLIKYAGGIAQQMQSMEELIRKKLEDLAARYLQPILDTLRDIMHWIVQLWSDTAKQADAELKMLVSKFGAVASPKELQEFKRLGYETAPKEAFKRAGSEITPWQTAKSWFSSVGLGKTFTEYTRETKAALGTRTSMGRMQRWMDNAANAKLFEDATAKSKIKFLLAAARNRELDGRKPPVKSSLAVTKKTSNSVAGKTAADNLAGE